MQKESWTEIEEFILGTLNLVRHGLDQESIDTVTHYVDHDEYEIAFEILFTEIVRKNPTQAVDYNTALQIGQQLNLPNESIYDPSFWANFETFCYNGKI